MDLSEVLSDGRAQPWCLLRTWAADSDNLKAVQVFSMSLKFHKVTSDKLLILFKFAYGFCNGSAYCSVVVTSP